MPHDAIGVRDVRSNSTGTYITLNQATKGTIGTTATVTVKKTRYGTFACLTCNAIDCRHARFVESGFNDGTIQDAA